MFGQERKSCSSTTGTRQIIHKRGGLIFAGEFYKAEDGAIHIDDNSGTYQPPKGLLEDVADFFRELFPGVNIIADARG